MRPGQRANVTVGQKRYHGITLVAVDTVIADTATSILAVVVTPLVTKPARETNTSASRTTSQRRGRDKEEALHAISSSAQRIAKAAERSGGQTKKEQAITAVHRETGTRDTKSICCN